MRIVDKLFPILFKGSRYADRLPIGKPEIIKNAKPELFKKFYTDWYRPDLMAVVAVGDFDKAAVEKIITARFGSIPAATSPRPRPAYDIPERPAAVYAVTTDKEASAARVEVRTLLHSRKQGSVGVYRQKTVDRLFSRMLNARFAELAEKAGAPIVGASVFRAQSVSPARDEAALSALVKEDGIESGIATLITETERVIRFGFTASELERQKENVLRAYERNAAEKANRLSGSRADEYIRNFLQGETLPTSDDEYALHKRFLPEVTLDEINKIAAEWFSNRGYAVVVTAPEKANLTVPDETKLAAVIKAARAGELKPYVDTVAAAALLDTPPAPGKIARTVTKEAIGITEWELSNGVKVVLKPTTFREDEILFRAFSPGGTSLASDKDYITARSATQVIAAGGLGKFTANDMRKVMTGKIASANPFIGELEEGLGGSSSRKDIETMFQLIYLRFTQPRADRTAFSVQAAQTKTMLANQAAVPEFSFFNTLTTTQYQNHPRRRPMTAATVDEWDLDKSLQFYKARFADASDFTFVFVGSFDIATMRPLVERYLGSLPSIRRKETWKDVGVRTPSGIVEKSVEKGIEPKSIAALVFSGPFVYEQTERIAITAMSEVLQTRLRERIREDLGGTYGVTANYSYQKFPVPRYSILISFGCAPDRVNDLIKRVFEEIELLKTSGPTDKQVADEKEALLREFETSSKQNNFLLAQILARYQHGDDPAGVWSVPEHYKKIDSAMIKGAAKKYLDTKSYVKVTLFPEKKHASDINCFPKTGSQSS
jgi:zinc protease